MLTPEEKELAHRSEYNFDHPDAFDFELLFDTLRKLKRGRNVEVPIYDFTTHSRTKQQVCAFAVPLLVGRGCLNREVKNCTTVVSAFLRDASLLFVG